MFQEIARHTGGAVLPFGSGSVDRLREMLEAIGVLAVGGVALLDDKQKSLPDARLLLQHLQPE